MPETVSLEQFIARIGTAAATQQANLQDMERSLRGAMLSTDAHEDSMVSIVRQCMRAETHEWTVNFLLMAHHIQLAARCAV